MRYVPRSMKCVVGKRREKGTVVHDEESRLRHTYQRGFNQHLGLKVA